MALRFAYQTFFRHLLRVGREQRRTLTMSSLSTRLMLITFVTPLATGIRTAAVIACALGLIGHAFPMGPARARTAGVWGASVGAGTGLGGLLTVVLDHGQGWRTTYAVTAVLAFGLAVAGRLLLPESGGHAGRCPLVLGLVVSALGRKAVAHVPAHKAGMGSGVDNTARYMGAALGVTLVVLLVGAGAPAGTPEGLLAGWNHAAFAAAAVSLLGAVAVAAVGRRSQTDR